MTTGSSTPFNAFTEKDSVNPSITLQYQSISAMPQYRSVSFEVSRIARDLPDSYPNAVSIRKSATKITSKAGRLQGPLVRRPLGLLHNLLQVCLVSPQRSLPHNLLPLELRLVGLVTPALPKLERPALALLVAAQRGRRAQEVVSSVEEVPLARLRSSSNLSRPLALVPLGRHKTRNSHLEASSEVAEHLGLTISPNQRSVCAFVVMHVRVDGSQPAGAGTGTTFGSTGTGAFGQPQNQQTNPTGGLFGGQPQQPAGGAFGGGFGE